MLGPRLETLELLLQGLKRLWLRLHLGSCGAIICESLGAVV